MIKIKCVLSHQEKQTGLKKGMKLEADDVANKIICVATILSFRKNQIKIKYDGWGKKYDTWMSFDSKTIHPVGYCQQQGKTLCPPKGRHL